MSNVNIKGRIPLLKKIEHNSINFVKKRVFLNLGKT